MGVSFFIIFDEGFGGLVLLCNRLLVFEITENLRFFLNPKGWAVKFLDVDCLRQVLTVAGCRHHIVIPSPFGSAEPEVNFIAHVLVVPKLTDGGVMLFEHIQHPLGDFVEGVGMFVKHGVSHRLRLKITALKVVKVPSELNCNCFHLFGGLWPPEGGR
jgi:hypothetical protein